MARNLLCDRPTEAVMPTCCLDAGNEVSERQGRAHGVKPASAGQVEKGFVDREGLDQRRHLHHQLPDVAAGLGVFRHVGLDDHGLGAELQRLEHRHGGFDAPDARDITGGGNNAARAAADDHRLVGKLRIVALFDRRIEGIAVDMGDGKLVQFGMAQQARAAAGAAAAFGRPAPSA